MLKLLILGLKRLDRASIIFFEWSKIKLLPHFKNPNIIRIFVTMSCKKLLNLILILKEYIFVSLTRLYLHYFQYITPIDAGNWIDDFTSRSALIEHPITTYPRPCGQKKVIIINNKWTDINIKKFNIDIF